MLKVLKLRIVAGVILLPFWCAAVKPYTPQVAEPVLEPWRWQEMTELSGHGVLCVDEAQDGTLWFGGIGGLLHYDGLLVKRIPFTDELKSDIGFKLSRKLWCSGILCLPDGSLLTVIESTLLRWAEGKWTILQDKLGSADYETRLVLADDGSIWLLRPNALRHFSADLMQQQVVVRASGGERLTSFCLDRNGDAWVVKNHPPSMPVLMYIPLVNGRPREQMHWINYPVAVESACRETSICTGEDGAIWYLDNAANAICSLDPKSGKWTLVKDPNARKGFFSLMRDRNGEIWAGGPGTLFSIKDSESRYFTSTELGLPTLPLYIFESGEGKWWVIIRGGYVYRMDPGEGQWRTYNKLNFECESADGTQWFLAANNHVVSYYPFSGRWLEYLMKDGVIGMPQTLHVSSHGLVWAIGKHDKFAAFSVFDGKKWSRYWLPDFALHIGPGSFLETADGTVWLGAMGDSLPGKAKAGGALQYKVTSGIPRLLTHHSPPKFPYAIAGFAQTSDGQLWLGSPQVFSRNPGAEGKSKAISELTGVFTHDIKTDAKGELWVAKGLFGIYRKSNDEWKQYTENDGLKGKLFVDLLPLQDGTLFAASDLGISRFDGTAWAGAVFSEDFGMAGRGGGMRQSRDGAIWFNYTGRDSRSPRVTMNLGRYNRYCTVRYIADTQSPDTFIEKHLDQVDSEGNLHVSWSGRDPWDNTPVDQLYYAWRLNDGEWSPFSRQTGRTFLGLESGTYRMEVRARDRDFNSDAVPAWSVFVVSPPVWQRAWFISMVLVIVGGAGIFIWMLIYFHEKQLQGRQQHLIEMDQMKTGFFTNISHELNTPLGLIRAPLERLQRRDQDAETEKLLDMAMRNVDRVSNLVTQVLDFRKLEQGRLKVDVVEGNISKYVGECIEVLLPLAGKKNISCTLEADNACSGWYDPEMLKKIITNLVNNAIKYTAQGGEVKIAVNTVEEKEVRSLLLIVEDNGGGIKPEYLRLIFDRFFRIPEKSIVDGSGIGLNLTKELVDLWGGRIVAESPVHPDPKRPGTRFNVYLPIDPDYIQNQRVAHEEMQ